MKIAICGPAASGKGTIARRVAIEARIVHVDLGLIFRCGAFAIKTKRVISLNELFELFQGGTVDYVWAEDKARIRWSRKDVTPLLLTQEIAQYTYVLASVETQQAELTKIANVVLATMKDVVCDGRNAGMTILPDADYKFFVTASLTERARRRHLDLLRRGEDAPYAAVLSQIQERDRRDTERTSNPLIVPKGAVVLETDNQSIEDSVRFILDVVSRKI